MFLVVPTAVVVVQAFLSDAGTPTLDNVRALGSGDIRRALLNSVLLSGVTAVVGATLGAVVAYAVSTAPADGTLRRVVSAASGVLAQFGGVMLAFAWIATLGLSGLVPTFLRDHLGADVDTSWLYGLSGFVLVYLYFQIPLMVIVFLPSIDGLRPQWREAAESLGGSTWQYWRHVAGPLLAPAFVSSAQAAKAPAGMALLLTEEPYKAYARAAWKFYPPERPPASIAATAFACDFAANSSCICRVTFAFFAVYSACVPMCTSQKEHQRPSFIMPSTSVWSPSFTPARIP